MWELLVHEMEILQIWSAWFARIKVVYTVIHFQSNHPAIRLSYSQPRPFAGNTHLRTSLTDTTWHEMSSFEKNVFICSGATPRWQGCRSLRTESFPLRQLTTINYRNLTPSYLRRFPNPCEVHAHMWHNRQFSCKNIPNLSLLPILKNDRNTRRNMRYPYRDNIYDAS